MSDLLLIDDVEFLAQMLGGIGGFSGPTYGQLTRGFTGESGETGMSGGGTVE